MLKTHIYWRGEISAAHCLDLPYESKCTNIHGHNYIVEVWIYGPLNKQGMVRDFSSIKSIVMTFDHANLNDTFSQPTAETLAGHLAQELGAAPSERVRVRVWEDRDSYAEAEWTP